MQFNTSHDSHSSRKKIFALMNSIYTKNSYELIQTSVSCVNVGLYKGRVGANFNALHSEAPDPFKTDSM